MEIKPIQLDDLQKGMPAITPSFGGYLAEASAFCLSENGHSSGVILKVQGKYVDNYNLIWNFEITDQLKRCLNDTEEATEYGATGIVLMLIKTLTAYKVIKRSRKGTGFDYWVGFENDSKNFQNTARLEISGILCGDSSLINSRVRFKIKQTDKSDSLDLPAIVVVVEFSAPI